MEIDIEKYSKKCKCLNCKHVAIIERYPSISTYHGHTVRCTKRDTLIAILYPDNDFVEYDRKYKTCKNYTPIYKPAKFQLF